MQGHQIAGVDWPNRIAKYVGFPVRADDLAAYGICFGVCGLPEARAQYVNARSHAPAEDGPLQEQDASSRFAPQDTGPRLDLPQIKGPTNADRGPEQSAENADQFRPTPNPMADAEAAEKSVTFLESGGQGSANAHLNDISGSALEPKENSAGGQQRFVSDDWPSVSPQTDFQTLAGQGSANYALAPDNYGFQPPCSPWFQTISADVADFQRHNLTVVNGDYYDVQIGFSFGAFNDEPSLEGSVDLSFASVLDSPASGYDLVVIEQDLVEINVIVQLNIGVVGATASDLNNQSNQAIIAEYGDPGGFQATLGGSIHASLIEQCNYAAGVASANQDNKAAILNGSATDTKSNGLSVVPANFDPNSGDLISEIGAGSDLSILYVTGTYYEINAIYQVSSVTQHTGGITQSETAMISDFDGVASHQLVRGDEFDLNTISQINYLSQDDQHVPFMSSDVFPADGFAPPLIEPPMIPLQGIVAQTGDMTLDLMAV